jgi:membrane-bound lytic murein transglycosylase B
MLNKHLERIGVFVRKLPWKNAVVLAALVAAAPPAGLVAQVPVTATMQAADTGSAFRQYLQTVRVRAEREGVSRVTLDRTIPTLVYLPRVVELDRAQPETPAAQAIPMFEPYRRKHVDAARINGGRAKYAELRPMLKRIEDETGVPEEVMIAIYGHETNYGRVTGNFHAPDALASLAFEGRRRELFEAELVAVLKMIDRGVPSYAITGSWAGALGKPQFLPSVYLKLARDGDGDGYADIWKSEVDAMTSIANYLRNAGWRRGEPWGFAVSTPASLNRASIRSNLVAPRCARVFARHSRWMRISEWKKMGLVTANGVWPNDNMQAALIEPDGEGQRAYLLGSNYKAILDYNCSNFYALSVGLLADAVRN